MKIAFIFNDIHVE